MGNVTNSLDRIFAKPQAESSPVAVDRAAFEAHIQKRSPGITLDPHPSNPQWYALSWVHEAWLAWQVAQRAASVEAKFWYVAMPDGSHDGGEPYLSEEDAQDYVDNRAIPGCSVKPLYTAPPAPTLPAADVPHIERDAALSDGQIDAVWESMPGGPSAWIKNFGYQQFARAIIDAMAAQQGEKAPGAA